MRYYAMFSQKGNETVYKMVSEILRLPLNTTNREIYSELRKRMNEIEKQHPEIWDTAVRECIIHDIEHQTNRNFTVYF